MSELPCSKNSEDLLSQHSDSLSDVSYDSDASEAYSEATVESVESSASSSVRDDRKKYLQKADLEHKSLWSTSLDILDKPSVDDQDVFLGGSGGEGGGGGGKSPVVHCQIVNLNLAHNSFSVVPRCLSCLCPNVAR